MRTYDRFIVTKNIVFGEKEIVKKGSLGQEVKTKSGLAKFIISGTSGTFTIGRPEFLRKTKVANL